MSVDARSSAGQYYPNVARDTREDSGQYYPGGKVIPRQPVTGDTSRFVRRGEDVYHKSEVISGIQHYKKAEIAFDTDMHDWGFVLTGDYVIGENGEYVTYAGNT